MEERLRHTAQGSELVLEGPDLLQAWRSLQTSGLYSQK